MRKRMLSLLLAVTTALSLCMTVLATEMPEWLRPSSNAAETAPPVDTPPEDAPATDTTDPGQSERPSWSWLFPDGATEDDDKENEDIPQSGQEEDGDILAGVSLITESHVAYISGSNGFFSPEANLTRAQAAQILLRLLPSQARTASASFTDVPAGAWYA